MWIRAQHFSAAPFALLQFSVFFFLTLLRLSLGFSSSCLGFIVCFSIFPSVPPPPPSSPSDPLERMFLRSGSLSLPRSTFNPSATGVGAWLSWCLASQWEVQPCPWLYRTIPTRTLALFITSRAWHFDLSLHTSSTGVSERSHAVVTLSGPPPSLSKHLLLILSSHLPPSLEHPCTSSPRCRLSLKTFLFVRIFKLHVIRFHNPN